MLNNRSSRRLAAALLGIGLAAASVSVAAARGGGRSSDGDSLERQEQQNQAFIQPYGYADPATYRLGHPRAGYEQRQWLEDHRGGYVSVRPYYGR